MPMVAEDRPINPYKLKNKGMMVNTKDITKICDQKCRSTGTTTESKNKNGVIKTLEITSCTNNTFSLSTPSIFF